MGVNHMLTPDQLAAIKARYTPSSPDCPVPDDWPYTSAEDMQVYRDMADLLADYERLTRHNQRMSVALAQLSDKENWGEYSMDYGGFTIDKSMWNGDIDPQQLAERALVEDN